MIDWLRAIAYGVKKAAWMLVPVSAIFIVFNWFFSKWLPARALQVLQALTDKIGTERINLGSVGVDWQRINQFVPVSEAVAYGSRFLAFLGLLLVLKWVRKLIPFS